MYWFHWLASVAFLTVALATVAALGGDALAPPPLSFEGAVHWAATREPIGAVFALIRLGALSSGVYVLVVVIVSGLVRAVDERRGTALLDRLTLDLARGLLGIVGLGTLSVTTSLSPAANAQTSSPETAAIREVDPAVASPPADAAIRPALDQPPASEQYVVAAGDCLWSVAAAHLGEVTGRADLSDADIAVYWRAVMDANPLPNPDLLFVDQVIELPAVAS